MSTATHLQLDTAALDQEGPFQTNTRIDDVLPSGVREQIVGVAHRETMPGTSPHGSGALTYIDQAIGGVQDLRGDVVTDYGGGFRSYRERTQPFNGDTLVAKVPFETVTSGDVGFQRTARGAQRAMMGNDTQVPEQSNVIAGFTNPGLARLMASLRGDR